MGKIVKSVLPLVAMAGVAAVTGGLGGFFASLIGSLAVGLIGNALFGRSPRQPQQAGRNVTQMVRLSNAPRVVVVGERMVSGTLLFAAQSKEDDDVIKFLHLVVVLATHEVDAIGPVYFNDKHEDEIPTQDGIKFFRINRHLGGENQPADADLVAEVPEWSVDHRLRGCAYLYVRLTWQSHPLAWPTGMPNVKAFVRGAKILDPRNGLTRWTNNPALAARFVLTSPWVLGTPATMIEDDYTAAAANACEELVAINQYAGALSDASATDDTITLPNNYLRMAFGDEFRVAGGTPPAGLSAGTDYYWRTESGQDPNKPISGKAATSIANLYAGIFVNITSAGSAASGDVILTKRKQLRYTCDAVITLDQQPADIVDDILNAMAGFLTFTQGRFRLFAGVGVAPADSFSMNDLRGEMTIKARVPRQDLFNSVRGTYTAAHKFFQSTPFPPRSNPTYVEQDAGQKLWKTVPLDHVNDPVRAQRIGKIFLEKSRQGITFEAPCNLSALRHAVGDVLEVDCPQAGWAAKEFQLIHSTLGHEGVDLLFQEYAAESYDWNFGEATEHDPAPDTSLPDPRFMAPPRNLEAASGTDHLLRLSEGSVVSRIYLTWTVPQDAFVIQYEIGSKLRTQDASKWSSVMTGGDATEFYVYPVQDGVRYDLRIRAFNSFGAFSEWVTLRHTVVGKTEPPPPVDFFSVERLSDGTRRFTWELVDTPADVRSGGGWRIRWAPAGAVPWESMAPLHTGLLKASPFETNSLPAGTYDFAIKTYDSSGNESANAIRVDALVIGDPRLENVLWAQYDHEDGWPGVLTDCYIDTDNVIRAVSDGDWTDLPATWAGLPNQWHSILPLKSPIEYMIDHAIDLGANLTFTPNMSMAGLGTPTFEMKVGTDADGGIVGSWVPLAKCVGIRYIRLRVSVAGARPTINLLSIILDAKVATEEFNDLDTSGASDVGLFFERVGTGHFIVGTKGGLAVITQAQVVAFQSAGSGWTFELVSKSATPGTALNTPAAEFKIYKNGVLTDAVVDVALKGTA